MAPGRKQISRKEICRKAREKLYLKQRNIFKLELDECQQKMKESEAELSRYMKLTDTMEQEVQHLKQENEKLVSVLNGVVEKVNIAKKERENLIKEYLNMKNTWERSFREWELEKRQLKLDMELKYKRFN